ncbi:DNA-binding transcriptional regulator, MarR family [Micromonospora sediminicola]|uniref:DNA-binding transcriptional regulator, MarR family n=1 Tax=Micromonospora sediminicola TaxID=946078 RepID=A0A1A9B2J1_9ACTN|nr:MULTISPECIES: MarR family transcriptional regulator [Micromonospora]PGH44000.1 MarR family transcriptional regulator [Micromonospora sp. WMMA1996]SBT63251.1 DNA-binding transcriptional regulator, MarR family [Micromonospora sediminicola]
MDTPDQDVVPARLAGLPSWLISQTAVRAGRMVSDGLAAVDARGYHFRLLATLDEFGAASQAALGRRSGIHVSDVVAALNELADRDYVTREPDPADRRRNVVTITPAGRRQLRRLEKQLAVVQDELLAPLSPEERAQLSRLLTRVLRHHSA